MIKYREKLGTGLFTVAEAALYARVSTKLISRWIYGTKADESVINPQYGSDERVVSFLDFVQTLAIREIRNTDNIPLQKIRQAVKLAKTKYGMEYPFAMHNVTFWDGNEVVICPTGDEFGPIVQASGKQVGQQYLKFMWGYMDKLEFRHGTICDLYGIFKHKETTIKMDPKIRFGEPMMPSGYSASHIWDAIHVERGVENVSKIYNIPLQEVETVNRFYVDYLPIGTMAA